MKKTSNVFWGALIMLAGIIWFGNEFDVWNIQIFFDGWWTLFIIIPSIRGLFRGELVSSFTTLILGVLMLLASNDIIEWSTFGKCIFPLILFTIGLSIMLKPKRCGVNYCKDGGSDLIGIFATNSVKVTDEFRDADTISIFGGVNLDLRKAEIKQDVYIESINIFGGSDILLPDNVNVKMTGVPIFGGATSKYTGSGKHTVYIEYVCIFGGLDIE